MSAGGVIAVAPISLTDRLKSVRDLLVSKNVIATERIFCGSQHADLEGDGLQITFVPARSRASTAVHEMSNREGGSDAWECRAMLWAVNQSDDYGFEQFAALESLFTELKGALRIVAGGRFTMSELEISNDTRVLKFGEHGAFSFSFNIMFQMVPDTESLPAGPTTTNAVPRVVS